MVHQFSQKTGSHSTGIHKRRLHLPSEVTVYPEGYYKPKAGGFYMPFMKKEEGKVYPSESKIYAKQEYEDPYKATAHEIGHHLWFQLKPEDKDEFILSLDRWWKRELPQHVGKEAESGETPLKRLDWQEYLGDPNEIFARFTSYYADGHKQAPQKESEEAWVVFKKIMGKYNGNLKNRLIKASEKVFTASVEPIKGDWREMEVSLRGI